MISIGNVFKGPELSGSPIHKALSKAAKQALVARGDFPFGKKPAVNIVFTVPGSQGTPDWEGAREGKYSAAKKLLLVEIAVPDKEAQSDTPFGFIVEMLHAANCIAFHFYDEKGLGYPLQDAESIVADIGECLES